MNKTLTYLSIILFQLGSATLLLAQEDSVKTVVITQDSITRYLSPAEYAFMMHEETNYLIKIALPALTYSNGLKYGSVSTNMAAEFRLFKNLTLDSKLSYYFFGAKGFYTNQVGVDLQFRWYYRMKKLSELRGSSMNLSGNYFLLNFIYRHGRTKINYEYSLAQSQSFNSLSIQAGWGLQRRFLQHGYFSLGIGAGFDIPLYEGENTSFALNTNMEIGLAFTKDKYVLNNDELCTIIKCFESSSFVLKSNLFNVISLRLAENRRTVTINPNLIAEKKLGKSPFSLQAGVTMRYSYQYGGISYMSDINDQFREGSVLNFKGLLEARWYYNLRKRMLKGKTGNGLAANYFGLGAEYGLTGYVGRIDDIFGTNTQYYYLNTGIQRFFSDHFYFDYSLSFGYQIARFRNLDTWDDFKNFEIRTLLGVGYRF